MEIKTTWLDELAHAYYVKLSPRIDDTQSDLLEILCTSMSTYRKAQEAINEHGLLMPSTTGAKANPAIKIQQDAFSRLIRAWKAIDWNEVTEDDELEAILGG